MQAALPPAEQTAPMGGNTIFAVASGAGRGAIAVLRVSGRQTGSVLTRLCGGCPAPRHAALRRLRDGAGETLDRALVLWMPGPASYTGEDSAEFHVHAGKAVVDGVADALVALGCRPAEPGEFTRRAFLNGRMDLVEAEAVADLIEAETAAQRRQALRQLDGGLGAVLDGWASRLKRILAHQEALIDFPDEDLPPALEAAMLADIAALANEMGAYAQDAARGERLREGLTFAVVGPPNVGKSSLINRLSGRDAAIVAPTPGTTRDAIEVRVVLGGVPVTLVDTAGLRETAEPVEAEGVRRARARAVAADLVILVDAVDRSAPGAAEPIEPGALPVVRVLNKVDLAPPAHGIAGLAVSARTGAGLDRLQAALADHAVALTQAEGPPPLTRARHRAALQEAIVYLGDASTAQLPELRAEELRLALVALGRIAGVVGVEDLLDVIFSQFCIGK